MGKAKRSVSGRVAPIYVWSEKYVVDYGKLGYLKAEDLAKRVANLERRGTTDRFGCVKLSRAPALQINGAGQTALADGLLYSTVGDEDVSAIVRLSFFGLTAGELTVTVYASGVAVSRDRVTLGSGKQDYITMVFCPAAGKGAQNLTVSLESGGYAGSIETCEVMLYGYGIKSEASVPDAALLDTGGDILAAYIQNGRMIIENSLEERVEARAQCQRFDAVFDVRAGACAVVTVEAGALYFDTFFEAESLCQNLTGRVKIADSVNAAAVFCIEDSLNRWLAVYLHDGKAYGALIDGNGSVRSSGAFMRMPNARLTDIAAVKGSARPMFFVLTNGDKLYFKQALPAVSAVGTVNGEIRSDWSN